MPEGMYGGPTILSHPIFVETILPFLLVFTVVFAILQKSKIFGDGKKQVDAIVALVVGLLVISFGYAIGIILQLTVFLAVALVVMLVLMLLLGSFGKGELSIPKALSVILIIAAVIAVVIAVLYVTNFWLYLYDLLFTAGDSSIFINAVFVVIIVGAIIAVILGGKK